MHTQPWAPHSPPSTYGNPYANPLSTGAKVGLGFLGLAVVGGIAYFGVRSFARAAEPAPTAGPLVIPENAWDRAAPYPVALNTTYRTTLHTAFPGAQLGVFLGKLADPKGSTIEVKLVSSKMVIGSNQYVFKIFTGDSPGQAEIMVGSHEKMFELPLQIG